ncbi:D-tyrosyl-tRNA(Tyr) deacylase [Peptoclostridium litorale DSM 5388]|uniref:D-aminoacyl-tRNA deacylase n=1 Tax=Peptoclostridium litorale DSM 5388 TaxID=1121324 RepID=A0A069RGG2_PEPLI|nr:D-aminoacyl-tRNA deacylase [Peptoclostridium litorale]KDR96094.1 D-tyrosyl-tRNA(Tyr) deacylase Dtd [Peptoclostridium litorale DSM 5388]SIO04809.1 D-tyrosyl-tRNA(Tyr) deacylase [Peptoclostridium litorale DSM 5388]
MRAVVQRVSASSVSVDNEVVGKIDKGLMVLLGVTHDDTQADVKYLVEKISNLRIFEDEQEKMNLSLLDIGGELLAISQFTLYGDCRKGRRPNFTEAAKPDMANELYEKFVSQAKDAGIKVQTGSFGAHMVVDIVNDGPVTIIIDSKKNF